MSRFTPEQKARIVNLWNDGESYSSIAAVMGCSRNVICGHVNRAGLARTKTGRPHAVRRPRAKPTIVRTPTPPVFDVTDEPAPGGSVTKELVEPWQCRFPYGDPVSDSFRHCGAKREPGRPYCPFHLAKAFQRSA